MSWWISTLERIERLEPKLNAFITVMADQARREARRLTNELSRGRRRGPLHGIPLSLKDLYYTKGVPTTAGSKVMADFVPDHDATTTARLKRAGGIIVGKNNLHEFAPGSTNNNAHYGPCHNPWLHGRIPGGSSGGSGAAVSAGMTMGTMGTDTAGSIRIPSVHVQSGGNKADVRAGEPLWGGTSFMVTGPCRADDAHSGRQCHHATGASGL